MRHPSSPLDPPSPTPLGTRNLKFADTRLRELAVPRSRNKPPKNEPQRESLQLLSHDV